MKWIISLLVLAVVLIAGCTTFSSVGTTNIGDIQKNPESFLNKEVEVSGTLNERSSVSSILQGTKYLDDAGITYTISYNDNQGYHYEILLKPFTEEHRTFSSGSIYKLKGIVKYVESCSCEYRYVDETGLCIGYISICGPYGFRDDCTKYHLINGNIYEDYEINSSLSEFSGYENYIFRLEESNMGWAKTDESLHNDQLSTTCPIGSRYFACNFTLYSENTGYFPYVKAGEGTPIESGFYKEYRCNPDSIKRTYYVEGTEPMVKL